MHQKVNQLILSFVLINTLTYFIIVLVFYIEFNNRDLNFYVFDIGQGDSLMIRTPSHRNILIDGGSNNLVVYKLGKYLPFYERDIDLMILTHPHADHMVGFIEVLRRYKVKRILMTGVNYNSADYSTWLREIYKRNIPIEIVDHQGTLELGDGAKLEILYPNKSFLDQTIKNLNNSSIVARLIYGPNSILLTGDFEDEESLVDAHVSSDILKVGHHGSDTANDPKFLKAVKPSLAVISCGQDNKFDHPHQQTLQNLENLNVKIWRTDEQGDFHQVLKNY